jgi:hypothetical protein
LLFQFKPSCNWVVTKWKPLFRSIEQKHFSDLVAKHLAEKGRPLLLEGGTGLENTRLLGGIGKS